MTLGSLYLEAQGCVPLLLENLLGMSFPVGGVGRVDCQGFLVREACVVVLVGGAEFFLSGVQ